MRSNSIVVAILFLLGVLHSGLALSELFIGKASVIDGDTLKINGVSHRLMGIDAPEINQSCNGGDNVIWLCGREAAKTLRKIIRSREVYCESESEDRYGRKVSTCNVLGRDLGGEMVARGYALAYRAYSRRYVEYENHASTNKLGMWSGNFDAPWDWRKHGAQPKGPGDCNIKGNINAKGNRLYHRPGDHSYAATIISTKKGERWFCSESEAQQAGWVPAWK